MPYLALRMLFLNWTRRFDNIILMVSPMFLMHLQEALLPTFEICEQKGETKTLQW